MVKVFEDKSCVPNQILHHFLGFPLPSFILHRLYFPGKLEHPFSRRIQRLVFLGKSNPPINRCTSISFQLIFLCLSLSYSEFSTQALLSYDHFKFEFYQVIYFFLFWFFFRLSFGFFFEILLRAIVVKPLFFACLMQTLEMDNQLKVCRRL